LGITLLGAFLSARVQAAVFTVNSPSDVSDATPGNGVCETASGNGVCTLRAAIMEANHFAGGPHTVDIPPGTYILTIPVAGEGDGTNETTGDLDIKASMSIVGAGSSEYTH
jgi:CSLREA domain-containing protein